MKLLSITVPCYNSQDYMRKCIDSLLDFFDPGRYADMPVLCKKYGLFPSEEQWRGKILLLESSEEKMPPEKYGEALKHLKNSGVFNAVNGLLIGKPMDEAYQQEYRQQLIEIIDDDSLPIMCNINIGHALPRCIIPFGVEAKVDAINQKISFTYQL